MSEKTCTKCGVLRPIEQFAKDSRNKSGYGAHCRECDRASSRQWYESNKVRHSEYTEDYYAKNRDKIVEYQKQYRKENVEQIREQKREYYLANKERLNARMAEYYERNREKIAAYQREYRAKRQEELRQKSNERYNNRDEYQKEAQRRSRKKCYQEMRSQILTALGGKCYCCGLDDSPFLTIDHINNDGKSDRKPNGKQRNSYMILRDIIKAGIPADKYQLACYNCNCARNLTPDKVCPHQSRD